MPRSLLLGLACIALAASGYSHALEITNLDEYYAPPPPPFRQQQVVGVSTSALGDPLSSRYVSAIADALQRSGSFERVIYPYNAASHQDVTQVVFDVGVRPAYSGSGSNFFVNFPGFLIFAPAIWGYGYHADIETLVKVTHLRSGRSSDLTVRTDYDFRQAEIDRTWTELGWLEWGVIPFIGGFFFMEYDPDVTREFIHRVSPHYGAYVASKIIPAAGEFREQPPAAAPPAPAPPLQEPQPPAEPAQPELPREKTTI
jgi:hypothetical protein